MNRNCEISQAIETSPTVPEPIRQSYYSALEAIPTCEWHAAYWLHIDRSTNAIELVRVSEKSHRQADANPANYYGIWYPNIHTQSPQELAAAASVYFHQNIA